MRQLTPQEAKSHDLTTDHPEDWDEGYYYALFDHDGWIAEVSSNYPNEMAAFTEGFEELKALLAAAPREEVGSYGVLHITAQENPPCPFCGRVGCPQHNGGRQEVG